MQHLFSSRVSVSRLDATGVDGLLTVAWADAGLEFDCRLDLTFVRPGKDQPQPVEAGKAPDRIGVMFCAASVPVLAGDRLTCIANAAGALPVDGVFEIRAIPDKAQDFSTAHHIEVQVIEVAQALAGVFPGSE